MVSKKYLPFISLFSIIAALLFPFISLFIGIEHSDTIRYFYIWVEIILLASVLVLFLFSINGKKSKKVKIAKWQVIFICFILLIPMLVLESKSNMSFLFIYLIFLQFSIMEFARSYSITAHAIILLTGIICVFCSIRYETILNDYSRLLEGAGIGIIASMIVSIGFEISNLRKQKEIRNTKISECISIIDLYIKLLLSAYNWIEKSKDGEFTDMDYDHFDYNRLPA